MARAAIRSWLRPEKFSGLHIHAAEPKARPHLGGQGPAQRLHRRGTSQFFQKKEVSAEIQRRPEGTPSGYTGIIAAETQARPHLGGGPIGRSTLGY
jgi:hypothetical protein